MFRKSSILTTIFYKTIKYRIRLNSSNIKENAVYILSGVRTPIGSFQGQFATLNAVDLGSIALREAVNKSCVDKCDIQEFVLGNAFPGGCGESVAFQIAMSSGLSNSVIPSNVNKLSASGMKAIMNGCLLISSNTHEVVAVGGVESLSNVPFFLRRKQPHLGDWQLKDTILHDGFLDPYDLTNVLCFVEEKIRACGYTRQHLDSFALQSFEKAANAENNKVFEAERVPVVLKKSEGEEKVICCDEEIKNFNIEEFLSFNPETGKDGTITTGNSSSLADGAAMLILASGCYVLRNCLKPLARIISYADASLNRKELLLATAAAIRKEMSSSYPEYRNGLTCTLLFSVKKNALERAFVCSSCISIWEISETFPAIVPLNAEVLQIDLNNINVNGSSISLGHPHGMTGARLIVHLAHNLKPGMLGCAAISHAAGGASAMIIEKFEEY